MRAKPSNTRPRLNELGVLLRHWRSVRGKSQFDVSLDSGVSQRHISFIESGRSVPGRQTLMDVVEALDVPLRERNTVLQAAGYAPIFSEGAWDAAEMQSVGKALDRMLRQHDPYPAMVMDRYWNVLRTNTSAPKFFNCFIVMAARATPRNMLQLMFDPAGMRPFIANWEAVATGLLQRVHRESVGRVLDQQSKRLFEELLAYPDVKIEWTTQGAVSASPALPVIPIDFIKDGVLLSYFSMLTTVGTPQTVALQELRIECMFPMNEATEAQHAPLLAKAAAETAGHSVQR
ncbi:MAG: helix-turn-helix transcriptional regulator [Rhizobacter sp.]